jgi:hypothetical protein
MVYPTSVFSVVLKDVFPLSLISPTPDLPIGVQSHHLPPPHTKYNKCSQQKPSSTCVYGCFPNSTSSPSNINESLIADGSALAYRGCCPGDLYMSPSAAVRSFSQGTCSRLISHLKATGFLFTNQYWTRPCTHDNVASNCLRRGP